jgi:hypothetical protein
MARRIKKSGALGSSSATHLQLAKQALDRATLDYNRMPPTCHGAIGLASRALSYVTEAKTHLWSMARTARSRKSKIFGQANILEKKLWNIIEDAQNSCHGKIR